MDQYVLFESLLADKSHLAYLALECALQRMGPRVFHQMRFYRKCRLACGALKRLFFRVRRSHVCHQARFACERQLARSALDRYFVHVKPKVPLQSVFRR